MSRRTIQVGDRVRVDGDSDMGTVMAVFPRLNVRWDRSHAIGHPRPKDLIVSTRRPIRRGKRKLERRERIKDIVPLAIAIETHVAKAVRICGGNQSEAAKALQCNRGTVRKYARLADQIGVDHAERS